MSNKISEALDILTEIGVPLDRQTKRRRLRLALTLLAVSNVKPGDDWHSAAYWQGKDSWSVTTREIINFWNQHYLEDLGKPISSGSYDDVRRKDLALLVPSGLILRSAGNPNANTNNPTRSYAINPEAVSILHSYGTSKWQQNILEFKREFGDLSQRLDRGTEQIKIPVRLPSGITLELKAGQHNAIQRAIVEEFLPRFGNGAKVLYIGDSDKKILIRESHDLLDLGFEKFTDTDLLPDIVAYDSVRNWLFLVEAVHSSNPIDPVRHLLLEEMTRNCTAPVIFVSAFQNRNSFRQFVADISWQTEVWIADEPKHLIHFDGEKFLGPFSNEKGL